MNLRAWGCAALVAALVVVVFGALDAGARSAAAPLCAFRESTTKSGNMATTKFHVVQNGCQLSFLAISKFAGGNSVFDTATGTFNASDTLQTMTVQLPCGVSSETDLVLGPATLYPPDDLDLGATAFDAFACPSGGGGGTGGGGGGSGGGGGGAAVAAAAAALPICPISRPRSRP